MSEHVENFVEKLGEDYVPPAKGTWLTVIESMSQSEFEKISEGLINWLVVKAKEPGIVQMRLNILNELIYEVEKSALNNLLPWEDA